MNEDPYNSPYRPGDFEQPIPHDAPTEMFSAPSPPAPDPNDPRWTQPRPSVRPEQLIRKNPQQQLLPGSLPAKLVYLWKSEPAYKVLFAAIGVVLLCSIVGLTVLGTALSHGSQSSQQATNAANNAPTPDSKQANAPKSAPTATPTPLPTPTPTPFPTPTPTPPPPPTPTPIQNATLAVQISNIPQTADNHSTISVTVTSIPGATVWLTILTGANPAYITTDKQATDGNGMAVITWKISERAFGGFSRQTIAHITAVASGQNGQQIQSQPATITINLAS
jgi:hypothetical protein